MEDDAGDGPIRTVAEIAAEEQINESYVTRATDHGSSGVLRSSRSASSWATESKCRTMKSRTSSGTFSFAMATL
jgi:hypothetical protein